MPQCLYHDVTERVWVGIDDHATLRQKSTLLYQSSEGRKTRRSLSRLNSFMPITMLCSKRGCRETLPCKTHTRNSTRSGYDYRWQKFRSAWIRDHPLCSGKWSECERLHRVRPTAHVDHDQRVTGPDDPRFYTGPFNALCHECHSRKTALEQKEY